VGEVGLHLFAGRRLESNHRLRLCVPIGTEKFLKLGYTARISTLFYLSKQHYRRNPVRPSRSNTFQYITFVRIKLGWTCQPRSILLGPRLP
jgi:hypothetical protein